MKCPYCAEEIQNEAIKCKHCGEWMPKKTYFHAARLRKHGDKFEMNIGGDKVIIENKSHGGVKIIKGEKIIHEIPLDKVQEITELNISGHNVSIQLENRHFFLWNSGFKIYVDSKPVEGTLLDPRRGVRIASYAIFYFAFLALVQALQNPDPELVAGETFFCILLVAIGILSRKLPLTTTIIGSLYGIIHVLSFIAVERDIIALTVGTFFRGAAALLLILGVFAAIRLRRLKKDISVNTKRLTID